MRRVSSFPLISKLEFDDACGELSNIFMQRSHIQNDWLSVDTIQRNGLDYLRVIRSLSESEFNSGDFHPELEGDEIEEDDDDEEILTTPRTHQMEVEYDIVLSPSYQVPVLYFNIKDLGFRTPPTMETLYHHLIPPQFKAQVENFGIIGGITVTDHPATNTPCFFIHPCQTSAVLEASASDKHVTPIEYLTLWIGAMGKCVGLNIPVSLVREMN